jgi:hypothetical protein
MMMDVSALVPGAESLARDAVETTHLAGRSRDDFRVGLLVREHREQVTRRAAAAEILAIVISPSTATDGSVTPVLALMVA